MSHWNLRPLTFFLSALILAIPTLYSELKPADPDQRGENYSLTQGEVIPIPAKKATLPLIVFGDESGQVGTFIPSGYMGDAGALELKSFDESVTLKSGAPGVHSLRISYMSDKKLRSKSKGAGWAGVYWQTPANNWAKVKGGGYDLSQAKKLTFWAKGDKGGEILAEVKVGGIVGPYPDTDVAVMGPIRLTPDWKKYTIDLKRKDLRHILGGFSFSIRRADNPHGAIFYLDEILFEGVESDEAPVLPNTALSPGLVEKTTANAKVLDEEKTFVVPFATRASALESEAQGALDQAAHEANRYPECRINVIGHTDSVGSSEVNKKLSLERAQAVADYLISHEVAKERIAVEGFGEEKPISPDSNRSEEGRQKNRRVEITLIPEHHDAK